MSRSPRLALLALRERRGLMIISVVFATFGEGLLLGVVPAATPDVGLMFGVSPSSLNWVNAAHLLAAGVAAPVLARLGDLYGHGRLLRIAAITALAGGLLCAAAPVFGVFILGRVLEGAIASFTPLAVGIARSRLDIRQVRRTVSTVIASLTGGSAVGLLVAAVVFRALPSARAVLWLPVAFSAFSVVLLFAFVPAGPETARPSRGRPDWLGFAALSMGLVSLLLGVASGASWGWASGRTLGCIGAGAALLIAWTRIENRVARPMVDLRAASRRDVAPFYIASFSFGCAYFGAQTATTYFLSSFSGRAGYGFSLNLAQIAIVLIPGAVLGMAGALAVAPLAAIVPHKRLLSAGCVTVAAGYVLTALARGDLTAFIVAGCVTQLGLGGTFGALAAVIAERSHRAEAGIAAGLMNTLRNVGGSTAGATFAALFSASTLPHANAPSESAFVLVWLICGGAAVATMAVVAVAPRHSAAAAGLVAGGDAQPAEAGA